MRNITVQWQGDIGKLDVQLRQQLGAAFYGLSSGPEGVVAHVDDSAEEGTVTVAILLAAQAVAIQQAAIHFVYKPDGAMFKKEIQSWQKPITREWHLT